MGPPVQHLQAVADHFGDKIVMLGLDIGPFTALGSREDGQVLLQELGVSYPAGTTFAAKIVRDYQVTGMPSTFFIRPDGEIVRNWTGILTEAKLSELVEELLAAQQAGMQVVASVRPGNQPLPADFSVTIISSFAEVDVEA